MSSVQAVRRPHLHALTGLRFVAAFYVVLYHYALPELDEGSRLADFFRAGPVAVSLFFILSGLVLAYGSTNELGDCAKPAREFWFARFSRIYPLFLFAVVASLPLNLALLRHSHSTSGALALTAVHAIIAMLMLQAWLPHLVFISNGPGWSLSVEAFFYLLFPFIVHKFKCRTVQHLLALTIPLWILSMAPSLVVEILERNGSFDGRGNTTVLGMTLTPLWFAAKFVGHFPLLRLAEFCIGLCLGQFVLARMVARQSTAVIDLTDSQLATETKVRRQLGWLGGGTLVALVAALTWAGNLREASEIMVNSSFATPLFAIILVSLTLGVGPQVKLLSSGTLIRLGTASYALYIIQVPFEWWWTKAVPISRDTTFGLVLFLVAVVAASIVLERMIEVPARRWLMARKSDGNWLRLGNKSSRIPTTQDSSV